MQVNNNQFWMQNAAQQNKQKHVNPLLKQVQHIIEQKSNAKASDAVSKEMKAKTETTKVDPKNKAISQVMDEFTRIEEQLYFDLGQEKARISGLVRQQDLYTGIVDGTADYDTVFDNVRMSPEDRAKLDFMDFDTYLEANGYQNKDEFKVSDWTIIQDSMGFSQAVLPGMVAVKDPGSIDKYMHADQVPHYEKWLEEKQAFRVEKLKEYATEQLPKLQDSIESSSGRISAIFANYTVKKLEAMDRLPKDFDLGEYLKNSDEVNGLFKKMDSIDYRDGKQVLELLNQILEKQQGFVLGLGGTANDVFDGTISGKLKVTNWLDAYA